MALKHDKEVLQPCDDSVQTCCRSNIQHNDSRAFLGRESRDLAEITIEGDESSRLSRANLEQPFVTDSVQMLIPYGHHIMSGCREKLQATAADVLVKLELHATGIGMTRSRAASAP